MVEVVLGLVAALIAALPQILTMIEARTTATRRITDALAKAESKDTDASMARVDTALDGLHKQ